MKTQINQALTSRVPKKAKPVGQRQRQTCPSEHEEQKALMTWATAQIGRRRAELWFLFSIPNGAFFGGEIKTLKHGKTVPLAAIRSRKMKSEGLKSGVPDLMLAWPTKAHHGLFIELKRRDGGRVSPEQDVWHEKLKSVGYAVVVAKGCEEAREAILEYLKPLAKEDAL
jgi:hypothetical protein